MTRSLYSPTAELSSPYLQTQGEREVKAFCQVGGLSHPRAGSVDCG